MKLFKPKPPPQRSILFVCTANITRSPVAESLFRRLSDQTGGNWRVASAGVKASKGAGAHPVVSFIMHSKGIPLNSHRSQRVTAKLMRKYRWIFVMEQAHRTALENLAPDCAGRINLLRSFGREVEPSEIDMPDPTGREVEDYRELFDLLEEVIPRIFKVLNEEVSVLEMGDEDKS